MKPKSILFFCTSDDEIDEPSAQARLVFISPISELLKLQTSAKRQKCKKPLLSISCKAREAKTEKRLEKILWLQSCLTFWADPVTLSFFMASWWILEMLLIITPFLLGWVQLRTANKLCPQLYLQIGFTPNETSTSTELLLNTVKESCHLLQGRQQKTFHLWRDKVHIKYWWLCQMLRQKKLLIGYLH